MKNIVTIDFDIVMRPSINLYNDLVGGSLQVSDLTDKYPTLEHCLTADFFLYDYLTRFLVKTMKMVAPQNIYFIEQHHYLVELLKDINEKELFNVYNIDHHHDIGYNDVRLTTSIKYPGCGDWVKFLKDRNKLNEYIWIHNDNSAPIGDSLKKKYVTKDYLIENFKLEQINKIDKLFICFSPEWIPSNIKPLFYTWGSICEEWHNKEYHILIKGVDF